MENTFKILMILPEGKDNAISADALLTILNLKSKRELQLKIAQERKAGALILSSTSGGYYTSKNRVEVAEFVRTLENRAKHTFLAIKTARRFLRETEPAKFENGEQISMGSL